LISTCEGGVINPVDYIDDMVLRRTTHLVSKLDELLAHRWSPEV